DAVESPNRVILAEDDCLVIKRKIGVACCEKRYWKASPTIDVSENDCARAPGDGGHKNNLAPVVRPGWGEVIGKRSRQHGESGSICVTDADALWPSDAAIRLATTRVGQPRAVGRPC